MTRMVAAKSTDGGEAGPGLLAAGGQRRRLKDGGGGTGVGGVSGSSDSSGSSGSSSDSSSSSSDNATKKHVRGPTVAHAIAGVCAGVATTGVLHPLDLVKTRLQVALPQLYQQQQQQQQQQVAGTQAAKAPARSLTYRSIATLVVNIIQREGAAGLYKGVTPNVLGNATAWGSYFFGYNVIKNIMRGEDEESKKQLSHVQHLVGATAAGAVTMMISNPFWVVKTRMCLQTGPDQNNYRSVSHALRTIVKEEGVRGLYRGIVPGLVGTTHGGVQFVAYEELKKRFNQRAHRHPEAELTTLEYILCATSSKIVAGAITYPYQVVRARQQQRGAGDISSAQIIRTVHRQFGVAGFYHGLTPYLIRVMPATCITFVVYEHLSHFLRRVL